MSLRSRDGMSAALQCQMTSPRLTAILFLVFAACGDDPSPEQVQLETELEQFSQAMHGSYKFTWRRSCECTAESTAPIRITVQAGQIIQAVSVETNQAVSSDVLQTLQTIEGVFETIHDAYAEGAAVISVTFDPTVSFPASVGIDYDLGLADEEFSLQISDVTSFDAT